MKIPEEITIEASVVVKGMAPLQKISEFFSKEYAEGKTEFRIMITGKGVGYIHAISKNGDTCDFDFTEYLGEEEKEG